jgi:putative NADH-flavin reductase
MKIVVFGAGGHVGRLVAEEALDRGHEVTAAVRHPESFDLAGGGLRVVAADALDPDSVASAAAGHDVAVSAIGPAEDSGPALLPEAARSLLAGLERAGVRRLMVVGGAGSLEVAPGVRLVDTPEFPEAWTGVALAAADALDVFRAADTPVDWTYVSPAVLLEPGERTGRYRVGGDQLLTDAEGNSRISTADYAIALVDEAENAEHLRERFTVAN